jgi:carboxyl-terminal processing protease
MALSPRKILLLGFVLMSSSLAAQAQKSVPEALDHDQSAESQSVLPLEALRVFTKTYESIRSAYVNEIDDSTLLEYAIRGMLDQLDPHSSFLDASSFEDLQVNTTGEFGGLGIEVAMDNGFVRVVSPIDDTPAARAGVEAGDLIIKLDDTAVKGLSLNEAVDMMRGPKGSKITLTIVREGVDQPIELTLTRDIIKVNSVRAKVMQKDFGYIRVAQFQVNTGRDVRNAISKFQRENPDLKGIVLDLRNNPGGVLQSSVEVADAFLDGGLVVYTEGRLENSNFRYEAEPGDLTNGLPLVVLINDGSASASEIVAGALQDHNRAVIMGTRSFGKGSVQTVIPITDDKAVKLTTALYFTPEGRSIQAQGIEPDIEVERVRVTAVKERNGVSEANLSGHLVHTLSGEGEGPAKEEKPEPEKAEGDGDKGAGLHNEDSQLYEALNLLRGLSIFEKSRAKDEPKTGVGT